MELSAWDWVFLFVAIVAAISLGIFLLTGIVTVQQNCVNVVTRFGKFKGVIRPGFNYINPFFDTAVKSVTLQTQSLEIKFQAITLDQANVYFSALMVFSVHDDKEETIKTVAFNFINLAAFQNTLTRTIEGCVRGFVATKKQAEILVLRREVVEAVKEQLDAQLLTWGYHLTDLQINDIHFDGVITESMAQVVASSNLKAAAENEGQALLIKRTKEAEANGAAIRISAEAEKTAAELRGQGVAAFRQAISHGTKQALTELGNDGAPMLMMSIWTDAMKHIAENGKGNMIFFDGSSENMNRTLKQLLGQEALK